MSKMVFVAGLAAVLLSAPAMAATFTANQAPQRMPQAAGIQLADDSDFGAKKDDYLHRAGDEMREWQQKLHDFGEKAEASGHAAKTKAKADLQLAWNETQEKWNGLQGAGADGWDRAKHAFENATAELKAKWHRVHPEDE